MSGRIRAPDETEDLGDIAERLHARFPNVDQARITEIVDRYHHTYDGRRLREFIPVLIELQARHELQHLPRQGSLDEGLV